MCCLHYIATDKHSQPPCFTAAVCVCCDDADAPLQHRLPEGYNNMSSSERSDWRRYRITWGDVLQDAAAALGCARALQMLLAPLAEMVAPKPFDWRTAELALHCLR